jgi:NADPH:quinone reductase-like Zn-dependent oxidoreductase
MKTPTISRPIWLELPAVGAVANLQVAPQPQSNAALANGEVEVRVCAVGLNFRDVLIVLGECPGNNYWATAGTDVAGTIAAHGTHVTQLPAHAAVFGSANGCFASFVRTDARLLVRKPAALSFAAATSLVSTWGTVHVAFQRLGLRAGQRLLLHAAAGGVGLAAVDYAKWLGVAVDGTAGKPHKHRALRQLGVHITTSSRDALASASGIARVHLGRRFHAVLNSLSLDFISLSAAVLGEGGAFEEIGKRGIWSVERARVSGVRCDVLDMAAEVPADPRWFQLRVLGVLADRAEAGSLHGLPLHAFDLVREAQAAFRLLQSGRNLGKVVLRVGLQHTSRSLGVNFDALSSRLLEYTEASLQAHDAVQLGAAYALLERLCQQYVQAALQALQAQAVPCWHHQLLLNWCKAQPLPPEPYVTREEVLQAHPDLWPEVSSPASNHASNTRPRPEGWMPAAHIACCQCTSCPLSSPVQSSEFILA